MALVGRLAMSGSLEFVPERVHGGCQMGELFEVKLAERLELGGSPRRELQPDHAVVRRILSTGDEPGAFGPIDEADRAVVAQKQVAGDVANGRPLWVRVTPNCQ